MLSFFDHSFGFLVVRLSSIGVHLSELKAVAHAIAVNLSLYPVALWDRPSAGSPKEPNLVVIG